MQKTNETSSGKLMIENKTESDFYLLGHWRVVHPCIIVCECIQLRARQRFLSISRIRLTAFDRRDRKPCWFEVEVGKLIKTMPGMAARIRKDRCDGFSNGLSDDSSPQIWLLVISAKMLMYLEGTPANGEKMPVSCIKLWSSSRAPWLIWLEMNPWQDLCHWEDLITHRG